MTSQYIAYTVKGLEQIAADEIKHMISDADNFSIGEKRVVFSSNTPLKSLTKLKTIDDIQILLASFPKPSTTAELLDQFRTLDLEITKTVLSSFRQISESVFSLTYGAVKTTDYSSQEVTQQFVTMIEQKYHLQYYEKDHSMFDVRIFIDETTCFFSVRITSDSLHHRKYKQFEKPGSLRPSIAAAMVRLATQGNITGKLVDNFCGSGTILCEARSKDMDVYGGDIDTESVLFTQKNLANIKKVNDTNIHVLDATNTQWPTNYFEYAISNLPYGKQIHLPHITKLYEETLQEYNRITKDTGVICLLLTNPDLMEKYVREQLPTAKIKTYPLGFTGQTPTIMLIQKHNLI